MHQIQILSWCNVNYTCTSHITEWKHTCVQVSLLWWTLHLITRVRIVRLHAQVTRRVSSWRPHFAYGAETARRGTGGASRGASRGAERALERTREGLRERVRQRWGAAGVPARSGPDGALGPAVGRQWSRGAGGWDVLLWLTDSVAGALFQMLQSVLKRNTTPLLISLLNPSLISLRHKEMLKRDRSDHLFIENIKRHRAPPTERGRFGNHINCKTQVHVNPSS